MTEKTERNLFLTSVITIAVIAFLYHRNKSAAIVPASSLGPLAAENAGVAIPQAGTQPTFTPTTIDFPPSGISSEEYPSDSEIPAQSFYSPVSAPAVASGCNCDGSGVCGANGVQSVPTVSSILSSLSNSSNTLVSAFFNGQF